MFQNKVFIALGTNVGNWKNNFNHAFKELNKIGKINKFSSIYLTKPYGFNDQNPYYNTAIELFTFYVYKYRDRILSQDSSLLETDFVTEHNIEDAENGFDIMKNLRLNWKSLDETEKCNIWKYLQVLIKITDKYIAETMTKCTN